MVMSVSVSVSVIHGETRERVESRCDVVQRRQITKWRNEVTRKKSSDRKANLIKLARETSLPFSITLELNYYLFAFCVE
jgi:hypothetical protein